MRDRVERVMMKTGERKLNARSILLIPGAWPLTTLGVAPRRVVVFQINAIALSRDHILFEVQDRLRTVTFRL